MGKCVFCGNKFEKLSNEHIIPNVICGRLKSKNLICENCNSILGSKIDSALDGVFSQIITMFSLNRERGEQKPIIVKDSSDGKHYKCYSNKKYELAECCFNISKDETGKVAIELEGPLNKKKLKAEVAKYCRLNEKKVKEFGLTTNKVITSTNEYIDTKWNELIKTPTATKSFLFSYSVTFSNKNILFAILKILFLCVKEFYPNLKFNEEKIIGILKNKSDEISEICYFYPFDKFLFKENYNSLSHQIYIKGSHKNKNLIGYIKLFSVAPFICLLDNQYSGKDFTIKYGYNYILNAEFTPECNEINDFKNIESLANDFEKLELAQKNIKNDLSRLFDIYYMMNPKAKWNEIQFAVEKRLQERLENNDIVSTNLFQFALNKIGELGDYKFDKNASEENINEVIDNFATAIINYVAFELKQYLMNKK